MSLEDAAAKLRLDGQRVPAREGKISVLNYALQYGPAAESSQLCSGRRCRTSRSRARLLTTVGTWFNPSR